MRPGHARLAIVTARPGSIDPLTLSPVLPDEFHFDRVRQITHLVSLIFGDVSPIQHGFEMFIDILWVKRELERPCGRSFAPGSCPACEESQTPLKLGW